MFPSCYPISQIQGPIYSRPSMKNTITFCSIGLFFREKWVWCQRLRSQNQSYHRFFNLLALRANRCWNNFGRSSIQIPVIPVLLLFFLFLSPFFNFGPIFRDHIQKRRKKKIRFPDAEVHLKKWNPKELAIPRTSVWPSAVIFLFLPISGHFRNPPEKSIWSRKSSPTRGKGF